MRLLAMNKKKEDAAAAVEKLCDVCILRLT